MNPEHIEFIPATRQVFITKGICYRPIKSWHSNTYAGEGLLKIPGTDDGSGCLHKVVDAFGPTLMAPKPLSVFHRVYWNPRNPKIYVSAFLSYPNGMGVNPNYFWEAMPVGRGKDDNAKRFSDEKSMETYIKRVLGRVK